MYGVFRIEHVKTGHAAVVGIAVLRTVSVDIHGAIDEIGIACTDEAAHELFVFRAAVGIDADERYFSLYVFKSSESVTCDSAYAEHSVMCSEIHSTFYTAVYDL